MGPRSWRRSRPPHRHGGRPEVGVPPHRHHEARRRARCRRRGRRKCYRAPGPAGVPRPPRRRPTSVRRETAARAEAGARTPGGSRSARGPWWYSRIAEVRREATQVRPRDSTSDGGPNVARTPRELRSGQVSYAVMNRSRSPRGRAEAGRGAAPVRARAPARDDARQLARPRLGHAPLRHARSLAQRRLARAPPSPWAKVGTTTGAWGGAGGLSSAAERPGGARALRLLRGPAARRGRRATRSAEAYAERLGRPLRRALTTDHAPAGRPQPGVGRVA